MIRYIFYCCCLLLPYATRAQHNWLSGKVLGFDDKVPVEGAIVEMPEGDKTITDKRGIFRLRFREIADYIIVHHTAYEELKISVPTFLNSDSIIYLKPTLTQLQEVVVSTGYEEVPAERATGSFDKISQQLINRSVSTDIISRVENLTPGIFFDKRSYNINVGGTPSNNITVRGLSTLRAGEAGPLIVLDNFPYEGSISSINPNDIESITVLKDAAASSIWGARAGNGVIVITTKKSNFNRPISFTFNSNVSFTAKPDLYADQSMSSSDFIDVERFLFDQGFYNSQESNRSRPALTPAVEILIKGRDHSLSAEEVEAQLDALRSKDVRNDFMRYMYRTGVNQQYSLGISGGGEKQHFILSAGYDKNLQNLISNSFERLTLKADNTIKPLKNLEVQTRLMFVQENVNSPSAQTGGFAYGQIRMVGTKNLYPYASLADGQGNPLSINKDYRTPYLDGLEGEGLLDWRYRPLEEAKMQNRANRNNELMAAVNVKYDLSSIVSLGLKYQYQRNISLEKEYLGTDRYYTRDLINRYTAFENGDLTRAIPLGGILNSSVANGEVHQGRFQLNVNKDWGNEHQLVGLAGTEIRQVANRSSSDRVYGYDDDLLTYVTNINYETSYPIFDNLAAPTSIPTGIGFSEGINRFVSLFANASYTYAKRYTVSASARRDASNLFGVNTNQKWSPLWSIGTSWLASNESFWRSDWLSYLKLRATFGYSGNVDNSLSAYTTLTYAPNSSAYQVNLPNAYISSPPNPELRWEKVQTLNIGADFALKNNRVSGSLEYYRKSTKDLLGPFTLDPTTGVTSLTMNSANTVTNGVDVELNTKNVSGAFSWNSSILYSYNKNLVKDYFLTYSNATSYINTGITPVSGYMAYPVFSYAWGGLDSEMGAPTGYINNELSNDYTSIVRNTPLDDLVYHGSARPVSFGALRNDFYWKGIGFSFNITYRFAYYFRRSSINYGDLFNGANGHMDYEHRWQKSGDELFTNIPAMSYPVNSNREAFYAGSEILVEKGDHIRLQDIRLSYRLNQRMTKYLHVRGAECYLYANNVMILWRANKLNLDPAVAGGIPQPRSLSLGLTLNF